MTNGQTKKDTSKAGALKALGVAALFAASSSLPLAQTGWMGPDGLLFSAAVADDAEKAEKTEKKADAQKAKPETSRPETSKPEKGDESTTGISPAVTEILGPSLTTRQRDQQKRKTSPLTLSGAVLKDVPTLPLGPSSQSDLDHVTLSLRDAGSDNQSVTLLNLEEAEGAAVRVQSRGISGLRSLGAIFDQSAGLGTTPPGGLDGSEVGLTLGGDARADGSVGDGFEIALQGSYAVMDALSGDQAEPNTAGLESRNVNLGLRLGYSGFNIDAILLQYDTALSQDSYGFEAGLSYQSGAFMARVAAREYRAGLDLQGVENDYRRYISYEFGARYRLTETFGLSGGFRHFQYDDHWLANPKQGENSQMIFLGGSFNF